MNPRKKSREAALQILFQKSFSPDSTSQELFDAFRGSFELDADVAQRAVTLTRGVENYEEKVIPLVERYSKNWRLDRIALTDLIILKLAIYELCFEQEDDTPPKMVISDYLDVAKKYSSQDAKKFINGILDEIYHKHLGASE